MDRLIRVGTRIIDNVTVTLTDKFTGKSRTITEHNAGQSYAFSAFSQWIAGKNNAGYQALAAPTQIQLGSSTTVGTFTPISGSIQGLNAVTPNSPQAGTTTFLFQIPAGIVTVQVTQAILRDVNGNQWYLTQFGSPFTPSASENITVNWQITFSN